MERLSLWSVGFAGVWWIALAGVGGAVTDLGPWYHRLRMPSWKPPDWLFGPAWATIFALSAVSAVLAWNAESGPAPAVIMSLFAANGVLNVVWSYLFFRRRRPDLALGETVLLWLSILAMIVAVRSASATAAWLLAPYLVWVTFAFTLNLAIVRLNPVAGSG